MNDSLLFVETTVRLLGGGCTIREALELVAGEKSNAPCARAAAGILESLGKGESLAQAMAEAGIIDGKRFLLYRVQLDRTGDIAGTFALLLAAMKRARSLKDSFFRALAYPALLVATLACALALLFLYGIPRFAGSGLIRDGETLKAMYGGIALTASTLAVSVPVLFLLVYIPVRKYGRLASYWTLLSSLSSCGIPFESCVESCDNADRNPDAYTRMVLRSAESTGDHVEAFSSIAAHHARNLENLYGAIARLAEPVIMLVAGIAVVILAVTVFLPLFNFAGGFA